MALVESPNFLYRVEIGEPDPRAGGRYRFTSAELAGRLSYFLTGSTPDAALLAAAEARKLDTPEGLRAEATRLLRSPAAARGLASLARELFLLDRFVVTGSDNPAYTASLRQAMSSEVVHLFQRMARPGSDAFEMLDTSQAFVTDELARIYDLPDVGSKTGVEVTLPAAIPRVGLLGTGLFLAGTNTEKGMGETAPVSRGLFVAEQLLCRQIPPPPPGVMPREPPPGVVLSKREALELHRSDPGCRPCHDLFDSFGMAFESFDPLGRYRTTEPGTGKPVSTTGQLDGQPFADARELARLLRQAPDAQRCFVSTLFRYAAGHAGNPSDEAVVDRWNADFGHSGRDLVSLLVEIVASDGFRYVSPPPAPQLQKPQ